MASEVSICNQALYLIGAEEIIALSDSNDRAKLCTMFYSNVRDAVLRAHDWNFATYRDTLSLDGDDPTPDNGYDYRYVLPTTPYCLRVLELNDDPTLDWTVEGRRLLTNEVEAIIKFIGRVTDVNVFDSLFIDCLAARLAVDLAYPITKTRAIMEDMSKLYDYKINKARGLNDREKGQAHEPTSPFILVR